MKIELEPNQDVRPGRIAPDFLLPDVDGVPVTFYERYCGQAPVVMVFCPNRDVFDRFAVIAGRSSVLGILSGPPDRRRHDPFPILEDDGRLTQAFLSVPRVDSPQVMILRPTLTIVSCLNDPPLEQIERVLASIPTPVASVCDECAPVLMVPDVLPPAICMQLMAAHDANNVDSGMIRMVAGSPVLTPDARTKIRRDHKLTDPDLAQSVTDALVERVLPVIARAFHYSVTQLEGYKVVAYDSATGGYFRLHRDNVTPDARHRRFALSLNLNDDYAGGEIVFPEFGAKRYRPPAGGALVFSGTLLHAAGDVTAGKRYVLLTFLWGDDTAG